MLHSKSIKWIKSLYLMAFLSIFIQLCQSKITFRKGTKWPLKYLFKTVDSFYFFYLFIKLMTSSKKIKSKCTYLIFILIQFFYFYKSMLRLNFFQRNGILILLRKEKNILFNRKMFPIFKNDSFIAYIIKKITPSNSEIIFEI